MKRELGLGSAVQRERVFFDDYVSKSGDFDPFMRRGWGTIGRRFAEVLAARRVGSLLDVGCGTGHSRQIYAAKCVNYVGVDLAFAALVRARRKDVQAHWADADACHLPFADASFDAVAFSSVLHHIPECAVALDEAYRVLKGGGVVFAFDPNLLHPGMAVFRWPKSPFFISAGVSPNEAPLLPVTLRRAFQASGFIDIRQRCQSDIPYRAVAPPLINALLSLYNAADRLYDAIGLGRWFGTFVITAARKPTGSL